MSQPSSDLPRIRNLDPVNWTGLWTLMRKEVLRFLKVYAQTIIAPVITTLLFYVVFAIASPGNASRMVEGVSYLDFLAPGLVMMSIAQNAFANTSSSIVISKVQGNIVDVLMPPLSPLELTVGYMLGGIARGLAVGLATIVVLAVFRGVPLASPFFIIFHSVMGSMLLALLGIIGGLWSEKFDHLAAVQNFIVMPATFLSGTFYTVDRLPEAWRFLCHLNPFFYMTDGFRYGFIGISDGTLTIGVVMMLVTNVLLLLISYWMIETGYKIKS